MGGLAGAWWRRLAVVAGTSWLQDGGGGGGLRLRALLLDLDLLDRHIRVHCCCFLLGRNIEVSVMKDSKKSRMLANVHVLHLDKV